MKSLLTCYTTTVIPWSMGNCTGEKGIPVTKSTCWDISQIASFRLECVQPSVSE